MSERHPGDKVQEPMSSCQAAAENRIYPVGICIRKMVVAL